MKTSPREISIIYIEIIVSIIEFFVFLWAKYNHPLNGHPEPITTLITVLITAIPIVFVTYLIVWDSSKNSEEIKKINTRNSYVIESEMHLQEIESWAQEMCVCTGWQDVEEIVMKQASSGLKHVYSRHLYTRHGRDYNGDVAYSFPRVGVKMGGQEHPEYWKVRFAKAVYQYIKRFEKLQDLEHETREILGNSSDNLFDFKNSFVGSLYKELVGAYPPENGKELDEPNIKRHLEYANPNATPIPIIGVIMMNPAPVVTEKKSFLKRLFSRK